jgi:hypothetical protein
MPAYAPTVSTLCDGVLQERGLPDAAAATGLPLCAVSEFVLAQHARMPDYLRVPLRLLTLLFDAAGLVHGGTLFHRTEPAARRRQIAAWRGSRFAIARDFIRLHEGLALFCWYSMLSPHLENHVEKKTSREPAQVEC